MCGKFTILANFKELLLRFFALDVFFFLFFRFSKIGFLSFHSVVFYSGGRRDSGTLRGARLPLPLHFRQSRINFCNTKLIIHPLKKIAFLADLLIFMATYDSSLFNYQYGIMLPVRDFRTMSF